jgi:Response regulators consisting of a CheY-like receiver domain and a winged-helix DNA-binding domain
MTDGDRTTVLVVDDEPDVADAYAAQLRQEYHVEVAYGGVEGLERLGAATDVVLLDRRMPEVPGDEVLRTIRREEYDVRVAMVTAVDPDFDIIEMPFDDYVTKPVSNEELLDAIERLLTCAEYEDQLRTYYRLTSKYAALLANKHSAALEGSDEFRELQDRRETVRQQLNETVDEFDNDDFAAVFRELHTESPTSDALDR